MTLEQLRADYTAKNAELMGILNGDAHSAETEAQAASLDAECERLKNEISRGVTMEQMRLKALARGEWAGATSNALRLPDKTEDQLQALANADSNALEDARSERAGRSVFRAQKGRSPQEQAYRFGQWFLAGAMGRGDSRAWCREHGIPLMTEDARGRVSTNLVMTEGVNSAGGFLVPPEFSQDIIDLREQFGVFRRNAKVVPMASDTKSVPRRTGGLTVYYPGENATITASDKAWDNVTLVAKKYATLSKYSSELDEDSIVDMASDLAEEIAYAFSAAEDDNGFNGDGTSTYGNVTGAREKLKGLSGTIANIAGLYVGTGNLYSELVLNDFINTIALLPKYADDNSVRWFVHRSFYYTTMVRVALAAGGVTLAEIMGGARNPQYLGYPVEITQKMPSTEANSQVCALVGDLRRAAMLGDRRQTTIAVSEHSDFASDILAIRGTQRVDIVVHDVGNAHATAASRVPGPLVGLITAAA